MSHDDEHAEKRWYLVCYDIRDPSRWREAYKTLCGTGEERLRWLLEQILDDEDDLMLVHLCPRCAGRVQEKGRDGGWSQDNPRYEVL